MLEEKNEGKANQDKFFLVLRVVSRTLGVLLALAAVFSIRASHLIQGFVDKNSIWGKIVFLPQNEYLLGEFPPTFTFGFLLALLSVFFFGISLRRQKQSTRPGLKFIGSLDEEKEDKTLASLVPVLLFSVFSGIVFYIVEWKQYGGFLPVGYWVLSILVPSFVLYRRDRKNGTNLKVTLTKKEWLSILTFTLFVIWVYSLGYNSWKYSFIGDEYAFFWRAEDIVEKGISNSYWFNADGVYRVIPETLSIYHAIWIKFWSFYSSNFGWRFASTILSLICVLPLYLIIRTLLSGTSANPKVSAFVGIAIFSLSELITTWSRIGQQPNSGLFPVAFGICFLLAGLRRNSLLYSFLSGVAWGIGILFNSLGPVLAGGAIASILIYDIFSRIIHSRGIRLLFFLPPILVGCGLLISSIPNLVQTDYYDALAQYVLHTKEDPGTPESRARKTIQTNLMFLHFKAKDHFMWGNVVNPLTAFLILLGFGSWKRLGWKKFLMMCYFLTLFSSLTAGLSHYPYLSVTWVLHGMVPLSIIAAIGFDSLAGRKRSVAIALGIISVAWLFLYNNVKMEMFNPYRRPLEYISTFFRPVQEDTTLKKHLFIFPSNHDPYIAKSMVKSFGYEDRVSLLQESQQILDEIESEIEDSDVTAVIHAMNQCTKKADLKALCSRRGFNYLEFKRYETPRRTQEFDETKALNIPEMTLSLISILER